MAASWALWLAVQAAPPAKPVEPVTGILEAFRTHSIVALAEGDHGNEQAHAFRLSLIRDSRFPTLVNDVVVEFGSARYQEVMDRFVRGDAVPGETLRQVWQNTTQPTTVWDLPIYEEFFRAVRAVNASLSRDRQIRVLLGDPPIDWDAVHTRDDLGRQQADMARDRYPADLIRREVVARNRRALVIYGDGHLQRRDRLINFEPSDPTARLLLMRLESEPAVSVFSIWTTTGTDLSALQEDVSSWPTPSLTIVQNAPRSSGCNGVCAGRGAPIRQWSGRPRFFVAASTRTLARAPNGGSVRRGPLSRAAFRDDDVSRTALAVQRFRVHEHARAAADDCGIDAPDRAAEAVLRAVTANPRTR